MNNQYQLTEFHYFSKLPPEIRFERLLYSMSVGDAFSLARTTKKDYELFVSRFTDLCMRDFVVSGKDLSMATVLALIGCRVKKLSYANIYHQDRKFLKRLSMILDKYELSFMKWPMNAHEVRMATDINFVSVKKMEKSMNFEMVAALKMAQNDEEVKCLLDDFRSSLKELALMHQNLAKCYLKMTLKIFLYIKEECELLKSVD